METLKFIEENKAKEYIEQLLKLCDVNKINYEHVESHHLIFLGSGYDCCFSAGTKITEDEEGRPVIEFDSDIESQAIRSRYIIHLDEPEEIILRSLKMMERECLQAETNEQCYYDDYHEDPDNEDCDYGPIKYYNPYDGTLIRVI